MRSIRIIFGFLVAVGTSFTLMAGEVGNLIQFQPNTKAKSSEVNQNFNTIKNAVNDNNSRISNLENTANNHGTRIQDLENLVQQLQQQNQQLQQQVQQLQQQVTQLQNTITQLQSDVGNIDSRVGTIESSNVMAMDPYVVVTTPDPNANSGALITFEGVNLQVVNGTGQTNQVNGLGNLIIGYNAPRQATALRDTCSLGQYWNDSTNCTANGGTWGKNFKTGSHNLIVGDQNAYSSYGGIVAGFGNVISREYAVVTGGRDNIAPGPYSSVSGGLGNTASGNSSSVSGGIGNTASGSYSSVSGGDRNTASGGYSSVSGGILNTASGLGSSVSGGTSNNAYGTGSSISGGGWNSTYNSFSSVSGGRNNTARDSYSAISGGDGCNISYDSDNTTTLWGAQFVTGSVGDCP